MIRLKSALLAFCLVFSYSWADAQTFKIQVQVLISHGPGNIVVSIYNSKDTFLKQPIHSTTVAIDTSGVTLADLGSLPAGKYAVAAYYDKNSNNKMDTNFIGIPKESVGVSNGAKSRFGPPKWKDALFEIIDADHLVMIQLVTVE